MLKFAVVGSHGRGLARRQFMRGLLVVFLSVVPAAAQSPTAFDGLIPELVLQVASAIPGGSQVRLNVIAPVAGDAMSLRTGIAAQLSARGLRVDGVEPARIAVDVGCGENLRERVCVATVRGDGLDSIASVTRPLAEGLDASVASLAIELHPLVSQRTQILDVAIA